MSRGINKVILIDHLGNDPEMRYTPAGTAITNMSVATTSVRKDKNSIAQEKTEWHNIVLFNRSAEVARNHLKKGSKIYIEGSLETRRWQDKYGVDKYTTEILAKDVQFLDKRGKPQHPMNEEEEPSEEEKEMLEQCDEKFFKLNSINE
jgi:single-strand DNA-binding protein